MNTSPPTEPPNWSSLHARDLDSPWLTAMMIVTMLAGVGCAIVAVTLGRDAAMWAGAISILILAGPFVILSRLEDRREKRLYQQLVEHHYRVCPACLYDLKGRSGTKCPECALEIRDEELQRAWEEIYDHDDHGVSARS